MEFNDKLKRLRRDRGISQQALADAIYVSRSALAKRENGLGMPGKASIRALKAFFRVDPGYFSTEKPEAPLCKAGPPILGVLHLFFLFPYTKTGMKLTVPLWQKPLTAHAQSRLSDSGTEQDSFFGFDVSCYPEAGSEFFEYHRGGYVGFFYSAGGEPVGFQGIDAQFFSYGRHPWLWHEETGGNRMEADHIIGNWYWYDMNF